MERELETKVLDAPPRRDPDTAAAGRRVGRYELLHPLGHGGMATVYLARATGAAGFERLVAVKVIHPHLAEEPTFVRMFLDEARMAAAIRHPNVAEIFDLGEDGGTYFMAMEYIDGGTLSSLVRGLSKGGKALPAEVATFVVLEACRGLQAAHELTDPAGAPLGAVHRDVSPQNLLVGQQGLVKLVDFGIMKAAGKRSETLTGQLRGKIAYMAPEQAEGRAVDARADLFALGVIAWELLSGQRLFEGASEADTLRRVIACSVPSLREKRPDLPDAVIDAVMGALHKDPEARFGSAAEMATALASAQRSLGGADPRETLGALAQDVFSERSDYVARRPVDPSLSGAVLSASHSVASLAAPQGSVGGGPRWLWPAAAVAVVALGGANAWIERPTPDPTPALTSADPVASATPVPEPLPEDQVVTWVFNTSPQEATVAIDGQERCPTPCSIEMPRARETVTVTLERSGYQTQHHDLAPMRSDNFEYALQPLTPTPSPRLRARPVRKAATKPAASGDSSGSGADSPLRPAPDFRKAAAAGLRSADG